MMKFLLLFIVLFNVQFVVNCWNIHAEVIEECNISSDSLKTLISNKIDEIFIEKGNDTLFSQSFFDEFPISIDQALCYWRKDTFTCLGYRLAPLYEFIKSRIRNMVKNKDDLIRLMGQPNYIKDSVFANGDSNKQDVCSGYTYYFSRNCLPDTPKEKRDYRQAFDAIFYINKAGILLDIGEAYR